MASVLARSKLLVAPNLLAYPAGVAPGFDPSHPASQNAILSAIASGPNFVNLTNGVVGTVNGTGVTAIMDSRMGPSVSILGNGNVSFAGTNGGKSTLTMAAIIKLTATSGSPQYALNDSATGLNGLGFDITAGNNFLGVLINNSFVANEAASTGSAPVLTGSSSVPYFIASSTSGTTTNFVVRRLDNGQVWIGSATTATGPTVGDGSLYIGNRGLNTRHLDGNVCAVLYSTAYLSTSQLLAWAYDPWAFWYPRQTIQYTTPVVTASTGGARYKQRWNRSPLAYPAGAQPGFDPTHVAANGALISCVPSGGNFVSVGAGSITGGVVGTPTTVSALVHGQFGPVVNNAGSGTNGVTFSSFPSLTLASCTIAAFALTTGSTGAAEMVASNTLAGGTASGFGVRFGAAGGVIQILMNNTVYNSSITPVANVPHFIVASAGNSSANLVVVNLQTGQVLTSVFAVNASTGSGSTFQIGNGGGTRALKGYSGPAMMNNQYMSMPQLLAWASDPWSFWYPNKTINLTSTAASVGATFLPVWAFDYNLSVLGTGTF